MPAGLKNKQDNQGGWGGKRSGAGRPKGSAKRPQIRDFITEQEVKSLVAKAKRLSKAGDVVMLKFVLEQIFGKAPQSVDLTSDGEKISFPLLGDVANKYAPDPRAKGDSAE